MYYRNIKSGEIVGEDEAYDYAIAECKDNPALMQELKDATVFWFFSGNWEKRLME